MTKTSLASPFIYVERFPIVFFCRNFDRIAAVTSSGIVSLFDLNTSKGFAQIHRSDASISTTNGASSICGIRFANENPALLFVAAANGNISMHDTRIRAKSTHVQTFHDEDVALQRVFTCFDVNANDMTLCAGSERLKNDAYIVLFDVRKSSTLATFTDSHRSDLTQVKFHPNQSNRLASGSTDGLINVFNVNETDEYDALEYCLNSESSVQTINWHPNQNVMHVNDDDGVIADTSDWLSCITDTNDFQLFDVNESELLCQAKRGEITAFIKRKVESDCYLVNCHNHTANGDIFLLAGSHFGGGKCLRSLTVHDKSFKPRHNLIENKQIVRCSVFNSKVKVANKTKTNDTTNSQINSKTHENFNYRTLFVFIFRIIY